MGGDHTESIAECWKMCQATENCKWCSFTHDEKSCVLYEHCPEIMKMNDYITSQVECNYNTTE